MLAGSNLLLPRGGHCGRGRSLIRLQNGYRAVTSAKLGFQSILIIDEIMDNALSGFYYFISSIK